MTRFPRRIRAADLRLLLAVAACITLFVGTPTTEESGCSPGIGTLIVANNGSRAFSFNVAGPERLAIQVAANSTQRLALKVGSYAWAAWTLEPTDYSFNSGRVAIREDRDASVGLDFR